MTLMTVSIEGVLNISKDNPFIGIYILQSQDVVPARAKPIRMKTLTKHQLTKIPLPHFLSLKRLKISIEGHLTTCCTRYRQNAYICVSASQYKIQIYRELAFSRMGVHTMQLAKITVELIAQFGIEFWQAIFGQTITSSQGRTCRRVPGRLR